MKLKFLLPIIILLTLSSCAYIEPDAKFTVTAFGVSARGKTVNAFLQAIDPQGSSEGKINTFEISGQGSDANLALRDIKTKLSKEASFEHCQLIIFSQGISEKRLTDSLELFEEIGIPLRSKIVFTNDIENLLTNEKIQDAADIIPLLKQVYKLLGFGKHTALFEIQTAVLTNGGNFALPFISADKNELQISGLMKYESLAPTVWLDYEESREYAKENS